jgi:flagellar motility protein MotE (MotC chaperone)
MKLLGKGAPSFRLIDGVLVAAVAMLGLKVIGLSSEIGRAPEGGPDVAAGFARVIAHARTNYEPPDPSTTGSVPDKARDKPPEKAAQPDPSASSAGAVGPRSGGAERALMERLGDRREELQQRAREMEARQKVIDDQERRLEEKLGELKASEDKQGAAGAKRAEAETAGLKSLVLMYETMKPKEAARVFDRLSHEVLVPVVLQMNPRKMAEVLAAMSPDGAEKLTVALARRARSPSDDKPASAAGGGLPPGELSAIEPQAQRR